MLAAMLVVTASLLSMSATAGDYGTTRFGPVAGLTSSGASLKDFSAKNIAQYHAGLTVEIPLGLGFCIQPSVLYQVKGMSLDKVTDSSIKEIGNSFEGKFGYVEVPVQFQWGPDLIAFRPYALAEPFVGYRIGSNEEGAAFKDALQKVEYGLGVGAGVDVWKFQVSAKWFWNFGDIYKSDASATWDTMKSMKNFQGIIVSLAFLF